MSDNCKKKVHTYIFSIRRITSRKSRYRGTLFNLQLYGVLGGVHPENPAFPSRVRRLLLFDTSEALILPKEICLFRSYNLNHADGGSTIQITDYLILYIVKRTLEGLQSFDGAGSKSKAFSEHVWTFNGLSCFSSSYWGYKRYGWSSVHSLIVEVQKLRWKIKIIVPAKCKLGELLIYQET